MALGVPEYHSEHLSPGVDKLLVVRALELLEQEMPLIIMPPFYYGSGTYAVAPPERNGGIHIDSHVLNQFARQLFYNLLRIGFRNIYVFVHHQSENRLIQNVTELIRYIGVKKLYKDDFRLTPWSLCQFDTGSGCDVLIPDLSEEDVSDMFSSSLSKRGKSSDKYIVDTHTDFRFQMGLGENGPWIEYKYYDDSRVKRHTGTLPPGQKYTDIADEPPDQLPSKKGVKLSIYCDLSGFMEIEACGGCPDILAPGTELSVNIITEFDINTGN